VCCAIRVRCALGKTTLGPWYLIPWSQCCHWQMGISPQVPVRWFSWSLQSSTGLRWFHSTTRDWLRRDFESSCEACHQLCGTQFGSVLLLVYSSARHQECVPAWHCDQDSVLCATIWFCWLLQTWSCLPPEPLYIWIEAGPHTWHSHFASRITSLGFGEAKSDTSSFIHRCGTDMAFLLLYVDDIVLTASSKSFL
jgi:hypothetical protein